MQDRSFSFESGVTYTSSTVLFPDCDSTCFSSYRYMIVEIDTPYTGSNNLRFYRYYDNLGNANQFVISLNSPFSIYSIGSDTIKLNLVQNTTLTTNLKITLTDSYESGITPTGTLNINENGTFDVTNYASAVVDVPQVQAVNYEDELSSINSAIYVCASVLLVLYFFYCIYRIIIRNSGVK